MGNFCAVRFRVESVILIGFPNIFVYWPKEKKIFRSRPDIGQKTQKINQKLDKGKKWPKVDQRGRKMKKITRYASKTDF